jgi:hypothetical protein
MRPIELVNGYMVCVECRGFIEAGTATPACECVVIDDTDVGNLTVQ